MDTHPFDLNDPLHAATGGDLDSVRHHFDDVMTGERPVDTRAYLLDPPLTMEQAAHAERRRVIVRRGSIAAAAVLAIGLLAPWPARGPEPAEATASPAAAQSAPPSAPRLPQRVDVARPASLGQAGSIAPPGARQRLRERPTAVPRRPARAARPTFRDVARTSVVEPSATSSPQIAPARAPTPAPQPARPPAAAAPGSAPSSASEGGALVPVG